jgi:hypothetical protein
MVSNRTLERVFGASPRTTARWGDPIRAVSAVLTCLVVTATIVTYRQTIEGTVSLRRLQDYGKFDASMRRLAEGMPIYAVADEADGKARAPNLNPPHFHVLLLPLAPLSPAAAFGVWTTASVAALLVSLLIVRRAAGLGIWGTATLAAAAIVSPAMHTTLLTGQVGLLLLLGYTVAWQHLRLKRDVAAALWLGVLASIKPFLLLFAIVFAAERRWRAVAALLLTVAAIFAAGAAALGIDDYRQWVTHLTAVDWEEHYMNASVLGLLERTFATTAWTQHPFIDAPWLVRPVWVIAAVATIVVLMAATRRDRDADRTFLMTGTAMLLLSPLGWVYYLWFLLPPLTMRLAALDAVAPRPRLLFAAALLLLFVPAPVPYASFKTGVATATLGSIYAWGLLAMFAAAVRDGASLCTPRSDTHQMRHPDSR